MSRTMYDTINSSVGDIPTGAEMVAGYVDGLYAWSDANWNRFPRAVKVRIAVFSNTDDGHVLDVESGDATPAEAPGWATMRRKAGVIPTIYCSDGIWNQVWNEFVNQKVPQPLYWIALYDNQPVIPAGAVAKQYINFDGSHGGPNYDVSIVEDYWAGVDPIPSPSTTTRTVPVLLVAGVQENPAEPGVNQGIWYYDTVKGDAIHLPTVGDVEAVEAATGLKQQSISYGFHNGLLSLCTNVVK